MNAFSPTLNLRAIGTFLLLIYRQRELTLEMTKREFSERYAGQMLGVLWGIAHPVVVILVYIFVFTYVFQSRVANDGNNSSSAYAIYLLAGLVPWMAMAETLAKGTQVLTSNSNLVKQVVFPLEVLPTKTVMASFFNQVILLVGVLLYAAFQAHEPCWSFFLVPILLTCQLMQMLGLAMILSTLGVYIRDLKDMVQVFCLVNVYLMPVIYMANWLPASFGWLIYVNPFSYQTLCFQDAIYRGGVANYWVWIIYVLVSLMTLGIGYRLFSRLRISIGNTL
jgi:lipopolysaccharide transport system permease protein